MELERYVEDIRHQLEISAQASGEEARALAERLVAPLESALRLALQDALAAAAEELTVELAPGSVELRLRGRDPEFVVSLPPPEPAPEDAAAEAPPSGRWSPAAEGDDATLARINLRLPEGLKARVEQAAGSEGLSVNTWLVRAAAAAIERRDPVRRPERGTARSSTRYTGWAR